MARKVTYKDDGFFGPTTIRPVDDSAPSRGRKVNIPSARARKINIEAAGDPISAMEDGSTEQTIKMMDDDKMTQDITPDTYHPPIDVLQTVDQMLKHGTKILDDADYQEFLSLDNEGKKKFVEEWDQKRKERFQKRIDFQNDARSEYADDSAPVVQGL